MSDLLGFIGTASLFLFFLSLFVTEKDGETQWDIWIGRLSLLFISVVFLFLAGAVS